MTSYWTNWGAALLLSFALTAVGGVVGYFGMRVMCAVQARWILLVWIVYGLSGLFTLFFSPLVFVLMYLVAFPFCCLGAIAEKATLTVPWNWKEHLSFLLAATLLSIILNVWGSTPASGLLSPSLVQTLDDNYLASLLGSVLGAAATPSALSLAFWFFYSAKLRPGLDRHFKPDDEAVTSSRAN